MVLRGQGRSQWSPSRWGSWADFLLRVVILRFAFCVIVPGGAGSPGGKITGITSNMAAWGRKHKGGKSLGPSELT